MQAVTEETGLIAQAQAERLTSFADQLDAYERLEAIRNMNELENEACVLKEKSAYNENMLARQQTELEKVKEEAVAMIGRAEEHLAQTRQVLAEKVAQLAELEG